MQSISLNVAAPNVSVGGNASVSIAAPSLKIEAPQITVPSVSLNVGIQERFGDEGQGVCSSGHPCKM